MINRQCKGLGLVNKEVEVEVIIPKHAESGQRIRYLNLGHEFHDREVSPGDLILKLNIFSESSFVKKGLDVVSNLEIDMVQAALGCRMKVKTIQGELVELNINPGTSHGSTLIIKGKVLYSSNVIGIERK